MKSRKAKMTLNPEHIEPQWDMVLIRQEKVEEKTTGGIFLPDEAKDRNKFAEVVGEVVKVGAGAFKELYHAESPPKAGDRIIFKKYAGSNFIDNFADDSESKYRMICDTDIIAIIKE